MKTTASPARRLLALIVAIAVVCGLIAAADAVIGGRVGMALLVARLKRATPLPNQPVTWQQGPPEAAGPRKPNVLVILVDDMGFNDITLNGGGVAGGAVPTPHINSLATDGVNCSLAYAGNATCSPSRAALMTGRDGTRFGFEFTSVPINFARAVGHRVGNRIVISEPQQWVQFACLQLLHSLGDIVLEHEVQKRLLLRRKPRIDVHPRLFRPLRPRDRRQQIGHVGEDIEEVAFLRLDELLHRHQFVVAEISLRQTLQELGPRVRRAPQRPQLRLALEKIRQLAE